MEAVKQRVWDHRYRHCDVHPNNTMMRAFPREKCEQLENQKESPTFFWMIDEHCVVLYTEHLVLLDPSFMVEVEDDTKPACKEWYKDGTHEFRRSDMSRLVETWYGLRKQLMANLPNFPLLMEMDNIMWGVVYVLSARDEIKTHSRILEALRKLRSEYTTPAERHVELTKWRSDPTTRAKVFGEVENMRSVADMRVQLLKDMRQLRDESFTREKGLQNVKRLKRLHSVDDIGVKLEGDLMKLRSEYDTRREKLEELKELKKQRSEYDRVLKGLNDVKKSRSWGDKGDVQRHKVTFVE